MALAASPFTAPSAFIALSEVEGARVQELAKIVPEIFEHMPSGKFYKLFRSEEDAVSAALEHHTRNSVRAAEEPTLWFVLKLNFSENQWLKYLLGNEGGTNIFGCPWRKWNEWHCDGELTLEDISVEWVQLTLAPIGLEAFAGKLLKRKPCQEDGHCSECSATGITVWPGSKRRKQNELEGREAHAQSFCAACWQKYLAEKFP